MIHFVDLTKVAGDKSCPACAFINTVNDRFVEAGDGAHVFMSPEEITELERGLAMRLIQLVPQGFWSASALAAAK